MTRVMYDDIFAVNLPALQPEDIGAGYDDGGWPDADSIQQRFPNNRVLRISVYASDIQGDILDVEQWDATPAQAPGWLAARRAQGAWPTLYVNLANTGTVHAAVAAANLTQPPYWLAHYDNDPTIPAGYIAKQYQSNPNYDVSSVADYWPGVDPAPNIGASTLTPAAQIRAWIIEHWGREPSVVEQYGGEVHLAQHGDDLTLAMLYDHTEAQAFRAKRGW